MSEAPKSADVTASDPKAVRDGITKQINVHRQPLAEAAAAGVVGTAMGALSGNGSSAELAQQAGEAAKPLLGAAALTGLEKRLHKLAGASTQGMTDEQRRQFAIKEGVEKAEVFSKSTFGLSGCMEAGKALNSSGVRGEVCAGVGFGGDVLPDFKKRGAGVSVRLQF